MSSQPVSDDDQPVSRPEGKSTHAESGTNQGTYVNNAKIDATIGFERTVPVSDSALDAGSVSKQVRDLAFAAVLLRSGTVTARRLKQTVADWTTHGSSRLSDHLAIRGLISEDLRDELENVAARELERIDHRAAHNPEWTTTQQDRHVLNYLDQTGKLARLLGISDASVLSPHEVETRQVNARYTLLRRLGQGGIGTVWLARDENLHRYVAVKEITRDTATADQALAHFRREAEITGKLEHPGIVPVYQFGIDEATGRSFYAMRFLGKRTLQDAISEYHERREAGTDDRLLQHRLLTAFVNVCQAVAHAHSRKVIHRDLKPENIAIDSFGQIVLLDWGLAKINDETGMYEVKGEPEPGDLHSIGSTHSGRVLGTPLYMAPEQAAGRLDDVDEMTDIYGLGGILYAILTGEGPHQRELESGDASRRTSEIFSRIVGRAVTPPSTIVENVPPELNAVCLKALANKRYLRYHNATELAEDIERFRAGAPVAAYDAPLAQRAKRWMATHPTLTQLLLLMATLTLLGGAAFGFALRQGRSALEAERFQALQDFSRELVLNLEFETQELIQDVRFVTDFPLTRAIAASQNPETADDQIIISGETTLDVSTVSADGWLQRQGRLLDGILEANPSYLVASSLRIERPVMSELVRSERLASGMRPRRVPNGQLYSGEHPESDDKLYQLRQSEVAFTTGDLLAETVPTKNRSPLVVVAICPIFDDRGTLFGFNVIELDLRKRLNELFLATANDHIEVYVTDSRGGIALEYRDGRTSQFTTPVSATDRFAALKPLFQQGTERAQYDDGRTLIAVKVRLGGESSQAFIGIIAHIKD